MIEAMAWITISAGLGAFLLGLIFFVLEIGVQIVEWTFHKLF